MVTHVIVLERVSPSASPTPFHKFAISDTGGAMGTGHGHDEDEALLHALQDIGALPR